jgi:hypothetical protein
VPLAWAQTQTNLGNALQSLGERESGTVRLQEAVEAYRAALEERTRARVPLDWAYSQQELAHALELLAERRRDAALLSEALVCIRGAAEVYRNNGVTFWLSITETSADRMQAKLVAMNAGMSPAASSAGSGR